MFKFVIWGGGGGGITSDIRSVSASASAVY